MKNLLLHICLCYSLIIGAQENFEQGSYADNNGNIIEGFINNRDWSINPSVIEFKTELNSNIQKISISNLQGFSIGKSIIYEKHKVKIDRSSNSLEKLSQNREPNLSEENLLLLVLAKNSATLYKYRDTNNTYFFYKENDIIHSLIYKKFLTLDNKIGENNFYQQQLNTGFKCSNGKLLSSSQVKYTESSLIKFFKSFGECTNNQKNTFVVKKEKDNLFNIKLIAGFFINSFEVDSNTRRTFDYGSDSGFLPGIELEAVFPKNKWSVFFDARYHNFTGEGNIDVFVPLNSETVSVPTAATYTALDFGLGGRYYVTISDKSSIFFGLNIAIDFISDTEIIFNEGIMGNGISTDFLDNGSSVALGIGLGVNINPINFEIRYHSPRNTLRAGTSETLYNILMFSASYKLFNF